MGIVRRKFTQIISILGSATLSAMICACGENPSQSPVSAQGKEVPVLPAITTAPVNTQHAGGVVDGSGGNLLLSTDLEVDRALEQLPQRLKVVLYRMPELSAKIQWRLNSPEHFGLKATPLDNILESYGISGLTRLQSILKPILTSENGFHKSAFDLLISKFITFKVQQQACHSENGPVDAAANQKGILCFSKDRLKKIAASALPMQTLSLAFHELSHVFGKDEADASFVQQFLEQIEVSSSLLLPQSLKSQLVEQTAQLEMKIDSIMFYTREFMRQEDRKSDSSLKLIRNLSFEIGCLEDMINRLEALSLARLQPSSVTKSIAKLRSGVLDTWLKNVAAKNGQFSIHEDFYPALERGKQESQFLMKSIASWSIGDDYDGILGDNPPLHIEYSNNDPGEEKVYVYFHPTFDEPSLGIYSNNKWIDSGWEENIPYPTEEEMKKQQKEWQNY